MTTIAKSRWVLAVDLGQSVDPTALALLEIVPRLEAMRAAAILPVDLDKAAAAEARAPGGLASIDVRALERLPLGMDYTQQVAHVTRRMRDPNLAPLHPTLVIDRTGCGRPVFDLFKRTGLDPIGVTIVAGTDIDTRVEGEHNVFKVSKLRLVSRLQAALHAGELRIAAELAEAQNLLSELQNFRATISEATGFASFGAREGAHDDLVLAVAIGAWWVSRPQPTVEFFDVSI